MKALLILAVTATFAIDGDTIEVAGERIRIANIDTPEIHHAQCDAERRLGLVAKRRVEELLALGAIVVTRGDPDTGRMKDRFGRTLAVVSVHGRDIGDMLIAEGLARKWAGKREPWCER
jgi:endonuclease YncB( thermonuclease family)